MNVDEVEVKILTEYSPEAARGLGRLTKFLSKDGTGEPLPEVLLRKILASNDHTLLVAVSGGKIIGAAIVVQIIGILREKAYLHEIVVDESVMGKGVADALWDKIEALCQERGLEFMDFTSKYDRHRAHAFYEKHGAYIRTETAPYRVVFKKKGTS